MSENGGNIENPNANRIIPVDIEAEMKQSFIDYAMSVIVDRALPDVRDGLKPVHRRILHAMNQLNFTPDRAYRKCATTVGEVLGKYHPHGDAAVYDSIVRLAQDFSLRYPLVDGHGNFGSIDGDPPAAMRYTESRLTKIAMEMLRDINKDTVDFKPNFDEHEIEPVVLPSRFPNLLVNGSSGIAVGMATNIPPHNLSEVIDGIIKYIENPDITIDELSDIIKGPDFPTGGTILGKSGIRDAYRTGKGRIVIRAVTDIEAYGNNRQRIVVTELPYQVNKARLIEKIADLVKDKRIEGISDLRDESDRDGMRIVIELKRDANAGVILNQLYKNTQLQDSFSANMLALVQSPDGKFEPKVLNLKEFIKYYLLHQEEVIRRRTKYDLEKAEARAHILEGLKIALDNLDEVINIIRSSRTEALAKSRLMERFSFSEKQSQAIVDMRLGRLTGLEREKLDQEYNDLLEKIAYYKDVLSKPELVHQIISEELLEIKSKYGDERRTDITIDESDIDMEDLIKDEDVVVTLTRYGYIKRTPIDTYKSQKRGGKGIAGLTTREDDFAVDVFITSTHRYILFFTSKGRVYKLRAWQIPEAGRQARGTAIVNLLELDSDEKVTAGIKIHGDEKDMYLIMATKQGMIKKTPLEQYENIRKGGIAAITLKEGDELIGTRLTDGSYDIILVTEKGMCIRFSEKDVRPMGRTSMGVMGIRLDENDKVISMVPYFENTTLLVVTANGFGKRTDLDEYKVQNRGGKGVLTYRVTEKTGLLIGAMSVSEDDDLLLISSDGTIIRMHVNGISVLSRVTQGVTLMRTSEDNRVVSLTRIPAEERDDEEPEKETTENDAD
ncbi:MAG: DNA gyrase subunit A [Clostridiaceae bacterium]|jgi:DNA gyrase subunit A|nr:DNA gyrase subunit A [Clostridiaceae bacterium]